MNDIFLKALLASTLFGINGNVYSQSISAHNDISSVQRYTKIISDKEIRQSGITMQKYDYTCGSAALTTLIDLSTDFQLNEETVIEGLLKHGEIEKIIKGQRFSLLDMKQYLEVLGING